MPPPPQGVFFLPLAGHKICFFVFFRTSEVAFSQGLFPSINDGYVLAGAQTEQSYR